MKEDENKKCLTFADRFKNIGYPMLTSPEDEARLLNNRNNTKARIYDELVLEQRIMEHQRIMPVSYPYMQFSSRMIMIPFSFPECLLSFLIYNKELYYCGDSFQIPIKIITAEDLAGIFGFKFDEGKDYFIRIFDNLNYFLNMPVKQRSVYEVEAYKNHKMEFCIYSAYPEKCTSERELKKEISNILKFRNLLGDYYINNGIPQSLADFFQRCFNLKNNIVVYNKIVNSYDLLNPYVLKTVLEQNRQNSTSSENLQVIHHNLHSWCIKLPVTVKKSFNISASGKKYEVSYQEKHFDCKLGSMLSLAPSLCWEDIRLMEFNEVENLLNILITQGKTCLTDLCMLFNSIRSDKYERRYYVFKVEEENRQLFHQFMDQLSTSVCLISDNSITNELLYKLTKSTLSANKLLLFAPKKATVRSFLKKLQSFICGEQVDYQWLPEKWSYSYKNSSTICLIDNRNIDIDFLKDLCAPYKCPVISIEFTSDLLDELLNTFSSSDTILSMEFFLLLCSFYNYKVSKKEENSYVGNEKGFKDFMDSCCILDEVKDDSSKLWVYADELHSAYQNYHSAIKNLYKKIEFRNKIFEMNYADENFYQKRHTKTPDGKDHNGNVYYGIQLRSSENYFENQEAKNNLTLSDKNNFTSENIYNLYKEAFTEISGILE